VVRKRDNVPGSGKNRSIIAVSSFWLLVPEEENSRIMPKSQITGGNVKEEMVRSPSDSEGTVRNNPEIGIMTLIPTSA